MKRHLISYITILTFVLTASIFASAQRLQVPQVSQKASVMQRIGLSEVSITYSRPAMKGRTVYGDWPTSVPGEATLDNQNIRPKDAAIVPWGHAWRTGASGPRSARARSMFPPAALAIFSAVSVSTPSACNAD